MGRVAQETRATASTRTSRHARPTPAKYIYMYDVPAAIQRQPCSTTSCRHTALGMIRAGTSGTTTQYDMGGIRRVAPPCALGARPARPSTQKPPVAQNARPIAHPLVILSQPKRHPFVTTQGAGYAKGSHPLTGTATKCGLGTLNIPFQDVANTPTARSSHLPPTRGRQPLGAPRRATSAPTFRGRPAPPPCPAHVPQPGISRSAVRRLGRRAPAGSKSTT